MRFAFFPRSSDRLRNFDDRSSQRSGDFCMLTMGLECVLLRDEFSMLDARIHIHLNSDELEKRHHDVYRQFFSSCPLVVSMAVPLSLTPSYAPGAGGFGIVSKLPLRTYVGFEPRADHEIEFGPWHHYLPEEDRFQKVPLIDQRMVRLEKELVRAWLGREGIQGPRGMTIRLLSEAPFYRGMGVGSTIAFGIASLLFLLAKKLTVGGFRELSRLSAADLGTSPAFDELYRLAWRLESIIDFWISPGDALFGSFIESRHPIVFFRERDPVLFHRFEDHGIEHPASYYNVPLTLFTCGFRIHEIFGIAEPVEWPLDVALLYIGEEGTASQSYQHQKGAMQDLQEAATFIQDKVRAQVPSKFREPPRFLELTEKQFGEDPSIRMYKQYREIPVIHSMASLRLLYDIVAHGTSSERMLAFFHELEGAQDILHIMGQSTFHKDRVCTILRECGYSSSAVGIAVIPRMRGVVMLIGERRTLEPVIQRAVVEIQSKTDKSVHCHFASHCDGVAEQGARVDQYIEASIYSSFIQPRSVTIREWADENQVATILSTFDELEHHRNRYDVVLDRTQGRIFVRGKPLTSLELHSAKQTIELFTRFFSSGKRELQAHELPQSFYRNDRNQMESKVIRPIATAVRQVTGSEFGLGISGGLGANYTVSFRPPKTLRVGFIEQPH